MTRWPTKMQEWAADRFAWVQYPHVKPLNAASRMRAPIRFAYRMTPLERASMLLMSLGGALVSAALMFAVLFVFGALIWGAFSR
jgi:hypothetical protein